jgi:hypothetical protein
MNELAHEEWLFAADVQAGDVLLDHARRYGCLVVEQQTGATLRAGAWVRITFGAPFCWLGTRSLEYDHNACEVEYFAPFDRLPVLCEALPPTEKLLRLR